MTGAIIGDIAGSIYEFDNTFDYDFPLFTDRASYTDDTICTVAVADAILKGADYGPMLLSWCRRYPAPMGAYGGSFSQWLRSPDPLPYGSFGNGSAMRVSPVAWAFHTPEEVAEQARLTALPTHNHREGIKGAQAVALAIHSQIAKPDKREIDRIAREFYPDYATRPFPKGVFDETCMQTVPLAFRIVMESTSMEDAIRLAVSHGGDSDTLGAIVGSIAEPLHGVPEDMRLKALAYLTKDMRNVVEEFEVRFGHH